MVTNPLPKLEKTVHLLIDAGLNAAVRKKYLLEIVNRRYKEEATSSDIDATIGLVNILMMDFVHTVATITFEKDARALSLRNTFNTLMKEPVNGSLREKWSSIEHNTILSNNRTGPKASGQLVVRKDISAFETLLSEVKSEGTTVFDNPEFRKLKFVRDKITAHFETKEVDNVLRIVSFKDSDAKFDDAVCLCGYVEKLISDMYLLVTGSYYKLDNIHELQSRMARNLAMRLPIVVDT